MPVPYNIPKQLLEIDFSSVDLYDFARSLYEFDKQSVFEPIRCSIPKICYKELFSSAQHLKPLIPLMSFEFIEYARVKILHSNGFTTKDGYCHSKKFVLKLEEHF